MVEFSSLLNNTQLNYYAGILISDNVDSNCYSDRRIQILSLLPVKSIFPHLKMRLEFIMCNSRLSPQSR